jgi:hypothetical protein
MPPARNITDENARPVIRTIGTARKPRVPNMPIAKASLDNEIGIITAAQLEIKVSTNDIQPSNRNEFESAFSALYSFIRLPPVDILGASENR